MDMMRDTTLRYIGGALHMEDVALAEIASALGTPTFVYSSAYIEGRLQRLYEAFAGLDTRVHYSVKANSNLAVLRLFKELGAGFDIVSGGELSRVLAIGADPDQIIFSGVGKSVAEIDFALKTDIGCFNVESRAELARISERAELLGRTACISLRVNPDVDAQTHPYISTGLQQNKFGIPLDEAVEGYLTARDDPNLHIVGIDCHIGSQISQTAPLLDALQSVLGVVDELEQHSITLEHIDLGGGMGITYADEPPLDVAAYGAAVQQLLHRRNLQVLLEPGRSLVANAGVLLTEVEYLKPANGSARPNFAIVNAAMNDLIRPALYQAHHDVLCVTDRRSAPTQPWDVVGPVCESGDFLARQQQLNVEPGDLLAIASAGAYGMVQASNYNSRGRACEVMVTGDSFSVIRRRENISDQMRLELPVSERG
jgi:diaminopimelate decarboxylase